MTEPVAAQATDIALRGVRTHNLKNFDLTLPVGRLIIVTGVSGSGKSSLAFDTLYAEGQRRYVESLSAYARQFLERMEKPDVDRIDGVCPAIAIRQKNSLRNPRSTVGTVTEIHDYLRLLFARVGRTFCRQCGQEVVRESAEVVARRFEALPQGTRLMVGFDMPVVPVVAEGADVADNGAGEDMTEGEIEGGLPLTGDVEVDSPMAVRTKLTAFAKASAFAQRASADTSAVEKLGPTTQPGPTTASGPANEPGSATEPGSPAVDAVTATVDALRRKGFGRLLVDGRAWAFDDLDLSALKGKPVLQVIVDRLRIEPDIRSRLTDAIETAYQEGGGAAFAVELQDLPPEGGSHEEGGRDLAPEGGSHEDSIVHLFSERFECPTCGLSYEAPQPRLFSFNNPFGACPTCHGFGNVIELDMDLVVPDPTQSIQQNAIEPWSKPHYRAQLASLKRAARKRGIRTDVPWADLTPEEKTFIIDGDPDPDGTGYDGIKGFFDWLERKKYKVHVRVFLSRYRGYLSCPACNGTRLRREARDVKIAGQSIDQVCAMTVRDAGRFFSTLDLSDRDRAIADKVLAEIQRRLTFMSDVGLDYLTLDRLSSTLSGGEAQRINLATALGSALVGTLYVLDEPSIGLHPRDNRRLIKILRQLRDQGNTVLVVEHDADMINVADHVVDLGLGAGERGGRVVYSGSLEGLRNEPLSLTAKYMRAELSISIPATRRRGTGQRLRILGATEHNLKNIDVEIPLNTLTCITGVSGSGKSTLVHDVLYPALKRAKGSGERRIGSHRRLEGSEYLTDAVLVDQAPIGRTPRSNPVTYLKAFDPIRELFATTKDARSRGLTASHFSFNVPGGRCEACEGEGQVRVEMQFLADVFVPCEQCDGKRFRPQVLEVRYKGKNVHQVLEMTVREALAFFSTSPKVLRRLQVLDEIGLGYLRLGQPATTLSGGEAQRIKIAAHLAAHGGERLLYILDEPTTGLHFDDISKLLAAFRKLLDAGHTLVVIEHNLDVIKTADYVIDLGPEGGEEGGAVVVRGTPEQIAASEVSYTGRHLQAVLSAGRTASFAPRLRLGAP
ncbi:MAG: excinuclease ABC subunit UvrA [Acidobacteria bacterium]|nr:excinuclease ABC subunit UvrA [Acidobacteriota bacterium]